MQSERPPLVVTIDLDYVDEREIARLVDAGNTNDNLPGGCVINGCLVRADVRRER